MAIEDAISQVNKFKATSLAGTIASIESQLAHIGADAAEVGVINRSFGVSYELLIAAAAVKQASAQIDVVIHAVGILYTLPYILQENEAIEGLSVGAGSAGSEFDLVTNQRVAEFKFIRWQGGAEAVRKQTLFQDFFKLAREETEKEKYLYLLNTEIPLHFLRGRSQVRRILSRNKRLADDFLARYGQAYRTVGEYYRAHKSDIQIVNLAEIVPGFDAFMEVFR